MAARHTKRSKIQPTEERMLRLHRSEIRNLESWCKDHNTTCMNFNEADRFDICVLSLNEYDLHECREDLESDNESRFLTPGNYEEWCEQLNRENHFSSAVFYYSMLDGNNNNVGKRSTICNHCTHSSLRNIHCDVSRHVGKNIRLVQ